MAQEEIEKSLATDRTQIFHDFPAHTPANNVFENRFSSLSCAWAPENAYFPLCLSENFASVSMPQSLSHRTSWEDRDILLKPVVVESFSRLSHFSVSEASVVLKKKSVKRKKEFRLWGEEKDSRKLFFFQFTFEFAFTTKTTNMKVDWSEGRSTKATCEVKLTALFGWQMSRCWLISIRTVLVALEVVVLKKLWIYRKLLEKYCQTDKISGALRKRNI